MDYQEWLNKAEQAVLQRKPHGPQAFGYSGPTRRQAGALANIAQIRMGLAQTPEELEQVAENAQSQFGNASPSAIQNIPGLVSNYTNNQNRFLRQGLINKRGLQNRKTVDSERIDEYIE